jgi:outer membrane protein TolC
MIKYVTIFLLTGFSIGNSWSQVITLDSCIAWAYEVQKFSGNEALIRQSQQLAMKNTANMNLPSLVLDFNATYQNENITIEVPPGVGFEIPNVPLNFNRLLVNFNQTIFNGRLTAQKQLIDSLSYDSRAYQIEVDKAQLKSKITGIYSSIVLVSKQRDIIQRQIATVLGKAKQIKGAVDAGAAYKSDWTNLKAESLKLQQNAIDLEYLESSLREQLSVHTAHQITGPLILPEITIEAYGVEARPELKLINSQKRVLMAQSDMASAARMPYVGAFGNVGVGYPGYDIFNTTVSPMLMIGIKVNWKIIDWQRSKNDRQLLSWNQDILSYQHDRVKLQFETELDKQKQEIAKYKVLLTSDQQIVDMRKEISQETSSRLSGGTATSTDYITQVNNEAVAELNKSIHEIKLAMAKISYAIIQGK